LDLLRGPGLELIELVTGRVDGALGDQHGLQPEPRFPTAAGPGRVRAHALASTARYPSMMRFPMVAG
jgi:hypothetical protein